jgi:acyl dehydratase
MNTYQKLSDLQSLVGAALGSSDWITIDQVRVDQFAAVTGDDQWIHIDPVRAAAGPFGATVAHGHLTLSLLPVMVRTAFRVADVRTTEREGHAKPVCVAESVSRHYTRA